MFPSSPPRGLSHAARHILAACAAHSRPTWPAGDPLPHARARATHRQSHDRHHEFFDYNFGVSVFMDKLLGTEFDGSAPAKRLKSKRAEPWHEKLI